MTREIDERTDEGRRPEGDDRVILFVDGGMSSSEAEAFEREVEASDALRVAVRRARVVRSLLRELPRQKAPSLETLMESADVDSPALASIFARLPRVEAPSHVGRGIRHTISTISAEATHRRFSGRSARPAWASFAAAAVLLIAATALFRSRAEPLRSGSRIAGVAYSFDVVRAVPGLPIDERVQLDTRLRPRDLRVPFRVRTGVRPSSRPSKGMGGRK